jgi:hypothetical protein
LKQVGKNITEKHKTRKEIIPTITPGSSLLQKIVLLNLVLIRGLKTLEPKVEATQLLISTKI